MNLHDRPASMALDAFTEAQKPDGPYCIKGYELPDDAYDGVKEAQEKYFDTGKTNVAMLG